MWNVMLAISLYVKTHVGIKLCKCKSWSSSPGVEKWHGCPASQTHSAGGEPVTQEQALGWGRGGRKMQGCAWAPEPAKTLDLSPCSVTCQVSSLWQLHSLSNSQSFSLWSASSSTNLKQLWGLELLYLVPVTEWRWINRS